MENFSNRDHLELCTPRQRSDSLLDLALIPFISNNFGTQNHGGCDSALMHVFQSPFAVFKPAFWCQKDKDQNDHTQKVPLPGISFVIPEEDLLKCGEQASHDFELASKQPREPWLAGELILTSPVSSCKRFIFADLRLPIADLLKTGHVSSNWQSAIWKSAIN